MPAKPPPPVIDALAGPPRVRRTRAKRDEKKMVSFRCGADLEKAIRAGAAARGISTTDYIVYAVASLQGFAGLPEERAIALRKEQLALSMDPASYRYFVLFMRSLLVDREGVGFDLPKPDRIRLAQAHQTATATKRRTK
jgi:uncharacterized protein (DUF1778 family)